MRSVVNYVADVAGKTSFGSNGPSAIKDTGVLGLGVTWGLRCGPLKLRGLHSWCSDHSLIRPNRQFITIRINEVEPAPTGERKRLAAYHSACRRDSLVRPFEVIRKQNHQRPPLAERVLPW